VVRDQVALAAEARDPEGVEDVRGLEREVHRAPGGQVQLVRRRHAVLRVAELPPPLVADHLDLQRVGRRLRLGAEDGPHGRDGDEDEDQRRDSRPEDLERGVPVDVLGLALPLALPELDDRVDDHRFDEEEDDRAPEEEPVPERVDRLVELGRVVERRVRVGVARARGERERDPCRQRGDEEPARAVSAGHAKSLCWRGLRRPGRARRRVRDSNGKVPAVRT
jgi:hypothetical protein